MSFHPYKQGPSTLTGGLLESETEPHELDAKFVTAVLVSGMLGFLSLSLNWIFFAFSFHCESFRRVGLLLCLASAWCGSNRGCFSQVKSESRHQIFWGNV